MKSLIRSVSLSLVLSLLPALGAEAQVYGSVGFGAANPIDALGDRYNTGYTARGQAGLSLALVEVHVQAGWTGFPAAGKSSELDDLNIYHAGVGARLGLGFLWVGANAGHFFGDGREGVGWFPEIGAKLWRLEGVLDLRVDGKEKWGAARLGFRF
jgi:hypothetical protein